jgi:hypothetical protein
VSVLDDLRDAEKRVAQRLQELEPAVAEYRELETVAQRLGIEVPTAAPAPALAPRPRRRPSAARTSQGNGRTRATGGRGRTQPGQREKQLLALIRKQPGITVREAGQAMSVDPTSLYRVVGRLEQRGDVRKNGRSLEPVGGGSSSSPA